METEIKLGDYIYWLENDLAIHAAKVMGIKTTERPNNKFVREFEIATNNWKRQEMCFSTKEKLRNAFIMIVDGKLRELGGNNEN